MPTDDELEAIIIDAARAGLDARAAETARLRASQDEEARAAREKRERDRVPAQTIFDWLHGPDAERLVALARKAHVRLLPLPYANEGHTRHAVRLFIVPEARSYIELYEHISAGGYATGRRRRALDAIALASIAPTVMLERFARRVAEGRVFEDIASAAKERDDMWTRLEPLE